MSKVTQIKNNDQAKLLYLHRSCQKRFELHPGVIVNQQMLICNFKNAKNLDKRFNKLGSYK